MPIVNRVAAMHEDDDGLAPRFSRAPRDRFCGRIARRASSPTSSRRSAATTSCPASARPAWSASSRGAGRHRAAVVGLRADMDALPILEATGVPYASKTRRQDARLRP